MNRPSLDIVIVNWNTGPLLRRAVVALNEAAADGIGEIRIIVVDNCSSDDSCLGLEGGEIPVELMRNGVNRGFAAACNQGAAAGMGDYILFLNPDVQVNAGSLRAAVSAMESPFNRSIGICGIRLTDERGRFTPTCARFPTLCREIHDLTGLSRLLPRWFKPQIMREEELRSTRLVDQVSGAFFLIRRELFARLGGFDARFFLYSDETDLSLRARQHGMHSLYLSTASARHLGAASSRQVVAERLFYRMRSRTLFFRKHYSRLIAVTQAALAITIEPVARLAHSLLPGAAIGPTEVVRGYRYYLRYLRGREPENMAVGPSFASRDTGG